MAKGRSPDAYCEAFYSRAAPLEQHYEQVANDANADPLADLGTLLSAGGDLAVVFDGMVTHAPDDIEPETVAVRDALKQLESNLSSNATNPLAALGSGLVTSLTSEGSFEAVSNYLDEHCPLTSDIAKRYVSFASPSDVESPSQAPPSDAMPPSDFSDLVKFSGSGRVNVIAGSDGFSIIDSLFDLSTNTDMSTISTYDRAGNKLATTPAGSLTGECGMADVTVPGRGRLVIGMLVTQHPAQGVVSASGSTQMVAWDAASGARLWSAPLADTAGSCGSEDGNLQGVATTYDGRWGVWQTKVINLATGDERDDPAAIGIIGDFVVDASDPTSGADAPTYVLADPASGAQEGRIPHRQSQDGAITFEGKGDLAPSGLFGIDSDSESPPSGTTSDGKELIAIPSQDGSQGPDVVAYALPSMKVLWQKTGDYIVGEGGGTLVMGRDDCGSSGACTSGIDAQTGGQLFVAPDGHLCGLTGREMLWAVNGQLAVLDVHTGRQMSYDSHASQCRTVMRGGVSAFPGEDNGDPTATQTLDVFQQLQP